jgi:hypothetical protein
VQKQALTSTFRLSGRLTSTSEQHPSAPEKREVTGSMPVPTTTKAQASGGVSISDRTGATADPARIPLLQVLDIGARRDTGKRGTGMSQIVNPQRPDAGR